jgi:hypothetical protein
LGGDFPLGSSLQGKPIRQRCPVPAVTSTPNVILVRRLATAPPQKDGPPKDHQRKGPGSFQPRSSPPLLDHVYPLHTRRHTQSDTSNYGADSSTRWQLARPVSVRCGLPLVTSRSRLFFNFFVPRGCVSCHVAEWIFSFVFLLLFLFLPPS